MSAVRDYHGTCTTMFGPHPVWLRLLIQINMWIARLSVWLTHCTQRNQEICSELAEEERLRESTARMVARRGRDTFPKFQLLPAELRQMVWEEALPSPRILMLRGPDALAGTGGLLFEDPLKTVEKARHEGWRSTASVPALLHVNSEARYVAQKHYALGFAFGDAPPRTYVDFARDTVGLSNSVLGSIAARHLWRLTRDVSKVRHLALARSGVPDFLAGTGSTEGGLMRLFRGLRDVVVVDSALFGAGKVSPVAEADYLHWLRWQMQRGAATWSWRIERDDEGSKGESSSPEASAADN